MSKCGKFRTRPQILVELEFLFRSFIYHALPTILSSSSSRHQLHWQNVQYEPIAPSHFGQNLRNYRMHLMYTLGPDGKRIYTLSKKTKAGEITKSAHPARFSPDDKYSRHRITLKKRFNMLPNQSTFTLMSRRFKL